MKRALVSVSDKTGLIDFLTPFVQKGLEVISTGGTLKFLNEAGLKAIDISQVTNFPEVLDGRVKTLHPHIHMGLLARPELDSHVQQMNQHQVQYFDLVVGNLYPFEKTALDVNSTFEQQIENIDIGGPSFLRSAAKNYQNVIVVSDPSDYQWVQDKCLSQTLSLNDRKNLALKVFSLTSYYDALIFQKLSNSDTATEYLNLPLKKKQNLRYGENAHQKAIWFSNPLIKKNLADAEIIQGKELSYNNLLDLDAAAELVGRFSQPACVAVKHNNPCGAAVAESLYLATKKAVESDSKSIFGGILAFNKTVDLGTVEYLHSIFLECLIAPDYTAEALTRLATKKNLRVLKWSQLLLSDKNKNFKFVSGGMLQQDTDFFNPHIFQNESTVIIGQKPTEQIQQDMIFGEKICASLKSNAIALVCHGQTIGLGMGQVNRIDAVRLALSRMKMFLQENSVDIKNIVAISDAFFPFADSVSEFQQAGLQWIYQPGGSVKDHEVIAYVQQHKMNMVLSGQRHFRH
jgi:phosphoribosylaminoimidazolecarboxamide formyltransferase / IMP cyclohydrolase